MANSSETILVVEDDQSLALGLTVNLRAEGFNVLVASDGPKGLRMASEAKPDLVVLDILLPGLDGFDVLKRLRARKREMPVIIMSARGELDDKLKGLGLGADDYVTKPFRLPELVARIHAALRRPRQQRGNPDEGRIGTAVVDLESRRVERAGAEVTLTAREFDLLEYLMRHAGRVHTRDRLLTAVWGHDYEGTARTVDNFIRSLRVKLETEPRRPRHLVTVRGAGYRFDP